MALRRHEAGARRDADEGSGGVKHVNEEQSHDHRDHRPLERGADVELAQYRARIGRQGYHPPELGRARDPSEDRDAEDAEENRPRNPAR